jgi:hypothetical protein
MGAWMGYNFLEKSRVVYLQFHDHYHSDEFIDALRIVMSNPLYDKTLVTIIDLTHKKGSYLGFNIQQVIQFALNASNLPSTVYLVSSNPILTAFGYVTKKRIKTLLNLEVVSTLASVQNMLNAQGNDISMSDFEELPFRIELAN